MATFGVVIPAHSRAELLGRGTLVTAERLASLPHRSGAAGAVLRTPPGRCPDPPQYTTP